MDYRQQLHRSKPSTQREHYRPCAACRFWATSLDRGLCQRCRAEQTRLERCLVLGAAVLLVCAAAVIGGWF